MKFACGDCGAHNCICQVKITVSHGAPPGIGPGPSATGEIAERAAREIQSSCLGIDDEMGIVIFEAEKAKAIVERAIAESQSPPVSQ